MSANVNNPTHRKSKQRLAVEAAIRTNRSLTHKALAKRFGVSPQRISQINLAMPPAERLFGKRWEPTEAQRNRADAIAAALRERCDRSDTEIARLAGCACSTAGRHRKRLGYPRYFAPNRNRGVKGQRRLAIEAALLEKPMSYGRIREIAEDLGASYEYVSWLWFHLKPADAPDLRKVKRRGTS